MQDLFGGRKKKGNKKRGSFLKLKHVPQKHAFIIVRAFVPAPAELNAGSIINIGSVQRAAAPELRWGSAAVVPPTCRAAASHCGVFLASSMRHLLH